MELHIQPAHVPALLRRRRRPDPLPRLWRAAGQQRRQRPQPLGQGRHPLGGLLHHWPVRERQGGRQAHRPERGLLLLPRRHPPEIRPWERPGEGDHGLAGVLPELAAQGAQVPLRLGVPHHHLAPRSRHPLRHRQRRLQVDRRGHYVAGHQPRPDAKRPREAGAVRPHHLRGPVGGDLLHHFTPSPSPHWSPACSGRGPTTDSCTSPGTAAARGTT